MRSENLCERCFYALPDANYNVLGMVNAAGNLVERYSYSPYGQRTVFSHGWSARPLSLTSTATRHPDRRLT